ncbi:MAG: hypothetical protein DCC49_13225 [Acidobacteria bacterium]|nr:MAG: hypothetical protein DCC49_13225 [Acidobacteriota bacterium]
MCNLLAKCLLPAMLWSNQAGIHLTESAHGACPYSSDPGPHRPGDNTLKIIHRQRETVMPRAPSIGPNPSQTTGLGP